MPAKSEKRKNKENSAYFFIFLLTLTIFLIIILSQFIFNNNIFCDYKTVCRLAYKRSAWDMQSPEFDCGIIYNRIEKYCNKSYDYVCGSHANIETTACSKEVLNILERQFNLTLTNENCRYYCCVTDGNCYNGVGINEQALAIGG